MFFFLPGDQCYECLLALCSTSWLVHEIYSGPLKNAKTTWWYWRIHGVFAGCGSMSGNSQTSQTELQVICFHRNGNKRQISISCKFLSKQRTIRGCMYWYIDIMFWTEAEYHQYHWLIRWISPSPPSSVHFSCVLSFVHSLARNTPASWVNHFWPIRASIRDTDGHTKELKP